MSAVDVPINTPEIIRVRVVDVSGAPVTGLSNIAVRIIRSDGLIWDWSDSTFKAGGSVVQMDQTMTQLNATYAAGVYIATWAGSAKNIYLALVDQTPRTYTNCFPADLELRVGYQAAPGDAMDLVDNAVDAGAVAATGVAELQAGLATDTAMTTALTRLADIQARTPDALDNGRVKAVVGAMNANVLTGAAIAADAVTKLQDGLATTGAVASIQTDVDGIETALLAIAAMIDALPTAAEINTELSNTHGGGSWLTATGFAIPGSAMTLTSGERTAVAGAVNTELVAAHGGGSWVSATGFAVPGSAMTLTSGQLDAIVAAVAGALATAHGAGTWTTATGFATPGSAMTLTSGERTAIAQAWIATAEGTPTRGTLGWNLLRVMQRTENPTEIELVNGVGRRLLYDAAGQVVISVQTLLDGFGNAIVLVPGSPARIGAST
jgi:hypothetical protein